MWKIWHRLAHIISLILAIVCVGEKNTYVVKIDRSVDYNYGGPLAHNGFQKNLRLKKTIELKDIINIE